MRLGDMCNISEFHSFISFIYLHKKYSFQRWASQTIICFPVQPHQTKQCFYEFYDNTFQFCEVGTLQMHLTINKLLISMKEVSASNKTQDWQELRHVICCVHVCMTGYISAFTATLHYISAKQIRCNTTVHEQSSASLTHHFTQNNGNKILNFTIFKVLPGSTPFGRAWQVKFQQKPLIIAFRKYLYTHEFCHTLQTRLQQREGSFDSLYYILTAENPLKQTSF